MTNVFDQIPRPEDEELDEQTGPSPRSNKLRHFHISPRELSQAKSRLAQGVDDALETLVEATRHAEYPAAIQAAKILLDRAGLGPSSTLHLETGALKDVPKERLAARALELLGGSADGQKLIRKLLGNERTNERTSSRSTDDPDSAKTVH